MVTKKLFVQAALVASSFSLLSAAQPALANQWTDVFRSLLVNPNDAVNSDTISVRETHLTNRIIDAINDNKLSSSDSQNLKAQLDRVKSMEANLRVNGQLGSIEEASLKAELNKVEASLNQMLSTTSGTTVTTNLDNTDATLTDVKQRITSNLSSGRLTIDEAQTLKNEYDHILNDRNAFKADGVISSDEQNHINRAIDDLQRNIASNLHDTQAWPGINGQQAIQAKRIEDGIASGRISRRESEDLNAECDRIANFESRARANGLQLNETIVLATDLMNLNQKISSSLRNGNSGNGGWPRDGDGSGFDIRQGNILRRIDNHVASGRLSAEEAADLRADYSRLEQLESSYRADGKLSAYEVDVLQKGLDRIVLEIKDKDDPIAVQYPEIDRKQQDLKRRINEGVARGRIGERDSQKLNFSLNWIASVEAAFRQSGGTMDQAEADRILSDLGRLSARIDRLAINPVQSLLNRKADLQRKIDENTNSGKISPRSSRNLRRELDRISYSLQLVNTGGTVSTEDVNRITADMDRLNTMLTTSLSYGGSDYRNGNNWHRDSNN